VRAESIAARGRVGQACANGVASSGRLSRLLGDVIPAIVTEVIRLSSQITRYIRFYTEI
jgi:hypothetical protein